MNDKEELLKLIDNFKYTCFAPCKCTKQYRCTLCMKEQFNEYLLTNGLFKLPCKVGDTIYVINQAEIQETTIYMIDVNIKSTNININISAEVYDADHKMLSGYELSLRSFLFGETAFLTRKEAEVKFNRGIK